MKNCSHEFGLKNSLRVAVLTGFSIFVGISSAQEDELSQLNTVLNIDDLYQPMTSQEIHGQTAVSLLEELQTKHYSTVLIDDNFSANVFDHYLDTLDASRLYFLRDDIDLLSNYRYTLDNSLQEGDVEPGFDIYNLYYKRILERMIYAIDRIENHIGDMDFTVDESIQIDREDAPYADTIAELDDIVTAERVVLRALKQYRKPSPKGGKLEWLEGISYADAKRITLRALDDHGIEYVPTSI